MGRASPKSMVENRLALWRRKHKIKYPNGNKIGKYTAYDTSMSWRDAEKSCQSKGQHLVTIKNINENHEVKNLAKSQFNQVNFFKPNSSRNESKETYLHCKILKTL